MVCSAKQDTGTVTDSPKPSPIKLTIDEGWGSKREEAKQLKMVDTRFPTKYVGLQDPVSNSISYYISI